MIGIFKPFFRGLPTESKKVYRCIYCSLCVALKKRHGVFYALFISHEIVQLNIACLRYFKVHPSLQKCTIPCRIKKKEIISHEALNISSDLCILLVWFKIVDSVVDKENLKYRILYYYMKNKATKIINSLPEVLKQKSLSYIELITNDGSYDEIIKQTGEIAALILKCIINELDFKLEDFKEIENIGRGYGELIALSDPLLDYFDDLKRGKRTPINQENYLLYYTKFVNVLNQTQQIVIEKSDERIINKYFKTSFLDASNMVYAKINNVKKIFLMTRKNTHLIITK